MELIKTIQIDDEIYLPLPVPFGIQEGQEFYIYKSNDGTLVLCPSDRTLSENTLSDFIDKTLYEDLKTEIKIGHEEIRQGNVQSLKEVKDTVKTFSCDS
ncbi:TPA: hypothetical protein ACGOWZ_000117 [Streptococcus suis]